MKHQFPVWFALLGACIAVFAVDDGPGYWSHWRGPEQNGSSSQKNLPQEWNKEGKNLLWYAPYGARTAPLVMDGQVYLINRAGQGETIQERVMALDLVTGKLKWEHRFNVFLTDIVEHRLGWAQLAGDPETGNIYAHGVQGLFMCYDKNGKILWSHSLTESFGRVSGYGGRTNSPIVEGDLVILSSLTSSWGPHGKGSHRFWAMDKRSGEILWWSEPSKAPLDTTYSVPVIATVDGRRTLFAGLADGYVHALEVETGRPLWSFHLSKRGLNTSVLYHEGKVFASHSEENTDSNDMGSLVCLDASNGQVIWRQDSLEAGYASPCLGGGMFMIPDNSGNLHAFDPQSGKSLWVFNYGTAAKGSPLYADGKVYVGEVNGAFHILQVDKSGAQRLHQISFTKENGAPIEIFGTPTAVAGRVLLPSKDEIYCIGSHPADPSVTKTGQVPAEWKQGTPDQKAATLLVVPAETWVAPGEKVHYRARLYDEKGRFIKETAANWTAKGVKGQIKENTFTAEDQGGKTQAGMITAQAEGLEATARLRIVPPLPYQENFDALPIEIPPAGWISGKPKSQVTEGEDGKFLRKLADRPAPAFARMRNYIMPPLEAGYTIQADMLGKAKKKRLLPDMGLINARYKLIILGTQRTRSLRLVTWDPMPRLQKDVPFQWEPDTWYTAKLAFHIVNGEGLLQAKVWKRGESEPAEWQIELRDPIPNDAGSPGLYGYSVGISESSPGTEVYYDNVAIWRD